MTEEGAPCQFPFTHNGVEYTNTCVFQQRRFWYESFSWCYTNLTSGEYGHCDFATECATTGTDVIPTQALPQIDSTTQSLYIFA